MELLPLKLRDQFGFDASKAASYREEQGKRQMEYGEQIARQKAVEAQRVEQANLERKQAEQMEQRSAERRQAEANRQKAYDEQMARQQTTKAQRQSVNTTPARRERGSTTQGIIVGRDPLLPPDATDTEEVDAVRARTSAISKGADPPLGLDADVEEIKVYYSSRIRSSVAAGKTELAKA